MGYEPHPRCSLPEPREPSKIWRYMDFTQLVSLLENGYIYFPQADQFDDPFEGSLPESHEEEFRRDLLVNEKSAVSWTVDILPRLREICKKCTYLSCWHLNAGESAAMWDIYLKSNQGICIQSTIDRFRDSITTNDDLYISKVNYIDYEEDTFTGWRGLGDTLSPFIHKRESFQHEAEIRAIIQDLPWHDANGTSNITAEEIEGTSLDDEDYDSGREVKVDLDTLIEAIHVSPEAEDWVQDLVEDVCETHDVDPSVVDNSRMTKDPYL